MKLKLERIARRDTYTIGRLYVDGQYLCDTLEDKDRGLTQDMSEAEIRKAKVYGETAIPKGTYKVTLNVYSHTFGKKASYSFTRGYLPRLADVPGYSGILIHGGNTAKDTLGCILVGDNKVKGGLINSLVCFRKLYAILKQAANKGDSITITII